MSRYHVTDDDRRALRRQAGALAGAETDEEPPAEALAIALAELNQWRADHGIDPLHPWWVDKTEPELHARARALGLLD
jgi:hypothetical protein